MARALQFQVVGHCIDCGNPHSRHPSTWRCQPCNDALSAVRYAARLAVLRAVRSGALAPAAECLCIDCEASAMDYDHRDYSRPLEVDPVCRKCNQRRGPAAWSHHMPRLMRASIAATAAQAQA
jgi:hypothetical protein